jgi:hypothetical protein
MGAYFELAAAAVPDAPVVDAVVPDDAAAVVAPLPLDFPELPHAASTSVPQLRAVNRTRAWLFMSPPWRSLRSRHQPLCAIY